MAQPKSNRTISLPAKIYLILYNVAQFLGWSFVFYKMVDHLVNKGLTSKGLWENVELPLLIFQSGAVLEIVHSAIGIVPSSVGVTFPQVFSRVFLLWPILYAVAEARDPIGFPLMLTAWTVTEVMRYLYYALSLISSIPHFLQWCRYSFFILLYPIGITGELICCYQSLSHYSTTQSYSVSFPNKWNVTFNFCYFTILVMLGYIPIFPQLYGHMFSQRRKIIGGKKQD